MAPQKLENNFLVSTLGKLLVFLVNYAYYIMQPFFIMKKLGKGALEVSERIIGISIISYEKKSRLTTNLSYDQPSGTN
jgi:small neutral amino acid transporter SnatA (MarC family)